MEEWMYRGMETTTTERQVKRWMGERVKSFRSACGTIFYRFRIGVRNDNKQRDPASSAGWQNGWIATPTSRLAM